MLRPASTRQVVHSFDAALLRDAAPSSGEMRFRVDLAPGRWVVVVDLGDLGDPAGTRPLLSPLEGLDVLANGALRIDDASARMQVSLPRLPILVGLRLYFPGATADHGAVRAVSAPIVQSLGVLLA